MVDKQGEVSDRGQLRAVSAASRSLTGSEIPVSVSNALVECGKIGSHAIAGSGHNGLNIVHPCLP
jgi:hypothetical protein